MSDTFDPAPSPEPSPAPGQEIEIDVAAFLPDDVEFVGDTDLDIEAPGAREPVADPSVDVEALSQIERDLDAVDAAIAALDAGTYGIDPATGQAIDDALLAENPTRLS